MKRKISLLLIVFFIFGISYSLAKVKVPSYFFSTLKARQIGPAVMGGRITAIEGVWKDPRILYVGTAGGGVFKSLNGGITFKPIFDKYTMSIGSIAVSQKDSDIVWVGTGECNVRNSVSVGTGLYKSNDGGKTWKFMGFEDSERIAKIVINPDNDDVVYVCVMGHLWNSNTQRGVYKTEDGGKTWKKILYVDENTGCADLEMDPQEHDVLYASMWQFRRKPYFFTSGGKGSGIFKTEDGGKSWKKLKKGLPRGELGRIAIAVSYSRPSTIYATVESKETALYRSNDMGESWKKVNETLAVKMRPFYFSNLQVSPENHRKIFVAGLMLSISNDGGKSFDFSFSGFGVHPDIHPIWVNPKYPQHVVIGSDGGIYVSIDGGTHFKFVSNLPVSQFYHVSYDMDIPYNVYGGLQDNGSWYGPSKSYGYRGIGNKEWKNIGGGDGFYVFPHPKDRNIIYYSWQGGNLVRFNRLTKEAKDIKPMPESEKEPEYRFNWNAAVSLSHYDPDTIYIGAQYLFRSRDRGDSWEKISPDLTTNDPQKLIQEKSGGLTPDDTGAENHCTITTISESPLDPKIIWVGTDDGNLQLTMDGGKTWINLIKNVKGVPKNTWVSSIEASRFNKGRAYVTFDGHRTGDMKPYVFYTDDFGKTWHSIATEEIRGYVHVIREDLKNENLLFLGTEFGLFISFDRGESWTHMKYSMPQVAVRDIAIHPRDNDLILATHGRGIMIIDDISYLRAINEDLLKKEAFILPSRAAYKRITSSFQEFPGDGEFFGDNLADGVFITYYLKKRHLFGDLKLEIVDKDGKIVKTLPAKKSRGFNRVFWDMRLKPPKVPASSGLTPVMAIGPMIEEGEYTVRLIKGKKVFEGKIKLLPDPLTNYSIEDRKIRHELIMKLYKMQAELSQFSDEAKSIKEKAFLLAKKVKSKKLRRRLKDIGEKLKRFHESIVQSKGLMTKGKLREKVMALYSSVISYGGRPTNSQIKYSDVLYKRIRKKKKEFDLLLKEIEKLNKKLSKEGFYLI